MRAFMPPVLVATLALALIPGVTLASRLPLPATLTTTAPTIVTIYSTGPNPQVIDVAPGTPIQWSNRDDIPHTVTADDGSFAPIHIQDGDNSNPLSLPSGVHPYHIDKVNSSAGTIVVHEASTPPTATPSPTGASSPAGATPTVPTTTTTVPTSTPTITATGTTQPPVTTSPAPTNTATPFATVPVTIENNALDPMIVTVTAGMGVQWTNLQTFPVTVTQDGGFVVGPIPPGGSAARLFAWAGREPYYVQGAGVAGLVVVQQAGPVPTATVSDTAVPATATASATIAATVSPAPTSTDNPSITPTAAAIPRSTPTPTMPVPTETNTATPTFTPTATETPSPTSTATPTATATTTPTATATATAVAASETPAATATSTATAVQASATVPTATAPATDTTTATSSPIPTSTRTDATPTDIVPVTITNGAFDPQIVEVAVGGYVRWTNLEPVSVTVRWFGGFTVGPIAPQSSAQYRFTQTGRIQYSSPEILAAGLVVVVLRDPAPTATPTGAPVASVSPTAPPALTAISPPETGTPTSTATATPSPSTIPTEGSTPTPALSPTMTPTATPTATSTATPTATPTTTPIPSPTTISEPSRTPDVAPASPTIQDATGPAPTDTTPPLATVATATGTPPAAPSLASNPPPTVAPQDNTVGSPTPFSPVAPSPPTAPAVSGATTTQQAFASKTVRPAGGSPSVTPHPIGPQVTPGHTLAPRHSPPPAPSHKNGATGAGMTTVVLSANGQVWRGRTRVDLSLSVGLRAGRALGRLRIHDARARLTLVSLRIDRLRSTRHGLLVGGMARANGRAVPFALDVEVIGRTTTVTVTVGPLRYHLGGAFHGRLLLREPQPMEEPRAASRSAAPPEKVASGRCAGARGLGTIHAEPRHSAICVTAKISPGG